jgi:hypothetical protein
VKTLLLVVAGLAAGFAVAQWLVPGPPESAAFSEPLSSADDADWPARVARLESALQAETQQRAQLERRVAELGAQLGELHDGSVDAAAPDRAQASETVAREAPPGDGGGPPGLARRGRPPETAEQRVERLVAGGFAPDRAAWIEKRSAELTMQTIQAQYARRRGENVDPALLVGGDRTLRAELGEDEYERYLTALGRPTKVGVFNVIASSPAEQAGLRAGDEILSYAGTRVFDMRELNDLTVEGTPGQSVIMEVERDGQRTQLVLPRGPIGIGGGPFGPRGR